MCTVSGKKQVLDLPQVSNCENVPHSPEIQGPAPRDFIRRLVLLGPEYLIIATDQGYG